MILEILLGLLVAEGAAGIVIKLYQLNKIKKLDIWLTAIVTLAWFSLLVFWNLANLW